MNIPKWLVIVLIAVIVVCLLLTVWAVFFRNIADKPLAPDYAPIEKDENAEKIEGDSGDKMEASEGGGAVSISFSDEISVDISEKRVSLYFANPGKSLQDIVLQVVIQDEIIVQTGTIAPGMQIRKASLLNKMENRLSEGIYNGKLVVLYYDTETSERAMISTEIPVTITVND